MLDIDHTRFGGARPEQQICLGGVECGGRDGVIHDAVTALGHCHCGCEHQQSGEEQAANLLQAAPQIDFLWNHDDDQGVGVLAAIENAGRDEFTMIGGAGSKNAMEAIQSGDSVLKATVIYPSTQAADGIKLARLIAQGKSMSDLAEVEVPRKVQLAAPVVTKDNVDEYMDSAFES